MIRSHFKPAKPQKEKIRWRSHEPHRIEAFSDAVFAFAVSLLVFSLEVPKSAQELLHGLVSFIPFVFCFAAIFYIWYEQYKFFRRFGMHDTLTMVLNAALMCVVLFFVYPLKFLFSTMFIHNAYIMGPEDFVSLNIIYNGGIACIFLLFISMNYTAYARRQELGLNDIEVFETKWLIYEHILPFSIALVIVLLSLLFKKAASASMILWGLMGFQGVIGSRRAKIFKKRFGDMPMKELELGEE